MSGEAPSPLPKELIPKQKLKKHTNAVVGLDEDVKRLILDEESVSLTSEGSMYLQAFTGEQFQSRVNQGLKRINALKAESGFHILSDGKKLFFSRLSLGTTYDDESDSADGVRNGGTAGVNGPAWTDDFFMQPGFSEAGTIGNFHFHPSPLPFSETDIKVFEQGIAWNEQLHFRGQLFFGVFMPHTKWDGKKYSTTGVSLLMLMSKPISNDYQGGLIGRLSTQSQIELFEKSGIKTALIKLPVVKNKIELTPLAAFLKEL